MSLARAYEPLPFRDDFNYRTRAGMYERGWQSAGPYVELTPWGLMQNSENYSGASFRCAPAKEMTVELTMVVDRLATFQFMHLKDSSGNGSASFVGGVQFTYNGWVRLYGDLLPAGYYAPLQPVTLRYTVDVERQLQRLQVVGDGDGWAARTSEFYVGAPDNPWAAWIGGVGFWPNPSYVPWPGGGVRTWLRYVEVR